MNKVFYRCQLLCGAIEYNIWINCNQEMVEAMIQRHHPKDNAELAHILNSELKREVAKEVEFTTPPPVGQHG